MKRLMAKQNPSFHNNMTDTLDIINALDDNATVSVLDNFTKERITGDIDKAYQWIIDMDIKHNHKCEFELV